MNDESDFSRYQEAELTMAYFESITTITTTAVLQSSIANVSDTQPTEKILCSAEERIQTTFVSQPPSLLLHISTATFYVVDEGEQR
jgi:hypothetical protein